LLLERHNFIYLFHIELDTLLLALIKRCCAAIQECLAPLF